MTRESYVNSEGMPSAILSDGLVTIPLYAVSSISLSESYHLPTIGSSSVRAQVATHDDTVSLTGLLVGPERYALKFALETLAESSKRGTALEGLTQGAVRTRCWSGRSGRRSPRHPHRRPPTPCCAGSE